MNSPKFRSRWDRRGSSGFLRGTRLDWISTRRITIRSTEGEAPASIGKQLAALPALDQPLWLGELPARDASPDYSLEKALDECRDAGVHGAAVWRWTKPEETARDVAIGCIEPATLRAWAEERRSREANA